MVAKPSVAVLLVRLRFLATLMLGAYLLINAILHLIRPFTAGWTHWSVTAVAVPPMVLGMVYLVIPLARRGQTAPAPAPRAAHQPAAAEA